MKSNNINATQNKNYISSLIKLDGNIMRVGHLLDTDLSENDSRDGVTQALSHRVDLSEQTELGQVLKEINLDVTEDGTRQSIDKRTRLSGNEISSHTQYDMLVNFSFLPLDAIELTKTHKRLVISKDGKGREEIRDISIGREQLRDGSGFWSRVKNVFTGGQK